LENLQACELLGFCSLSMAKRKKTHEKKRPRYPTDLSAKKGQIIEELIPAPSALGRPRATNMRRVLDAVFYVKRIGCAW
jgi:putative transposase